MGTRAVRVCACMCVRACVRACVCERERETEGSNVNELLVTLF